MSLASNQALVGLGDARGIRHVLKGHAMAALAAGHESRQVPGPVGERASLRIVAFLAAALGGRLQMTVVCVWTTRTWISH